MYLQMLCWLTWSLHLQDNLYDTQVLLITVASSCVGVQVLLIRISDVVLTYMEDDSQADLYDTQALLITVAYSCVGLGEQWVACPFSGISVKQALCGRDMHTPHVHQCGERAFEVGEWQENCMDDNDWSLSFITWDTPKDPLPKHKICDFCPPCRWVEHEKCAQIWIPPQKRYTFGTFWVQFCQNCTKSVPTKVHFWYTFGSLPKNPIKIVFLSIPQIFPEYLYSWEVHSHFRLNNPLRNQHHGRSW